MVPRPLQLGILKSDLPRIGPLKSNGEDMAAEMVSLAVIAVIALACPVLSHAIPGRPIPETVFLLLAGIVFGPYVLGIIHTGEPIVLLKELGLAFLFLLAGYEINPKSITGRQGKRAVATWAITFLLACVAVFLIPNIAVRDINGVALAIAMTTTALGTLMPIISERGLLGTRVGDLVLAHGTWGELCPILAMSVFLSTRSHWATVVILLLFAAIAITAAVLPKRARAAGSSLFTFIQKHADGSSQMLVRAVLVLLIGLVAVSAVFDLDIVLGAFAAGFVLRYVVPEENHLMEGKLNSIAYGFLVPLFFVVSGAAIDPAAIFSQPIMLVAFIALLFIVRGLPIFVCLSADSESRDLPIRIRASVAAYCTTALPLIVAVTTVAVDAGAMLQSTASVLVAAGAVTVFLMPLIAKTLSKPQQD